jgi:hypothetical protein
LIIKTKRTQTLFKDGRIRTRRQKRSFGERRNLLQSCKGDGAVRAGKRTYFFDVRATRRNEYYLTITESKKRIEQDGRFYYEKHKIFLYKEDFDKFADGLQEVVDYIRSSQIDNEEVRMEEKEFTPAFSDIAFEDLSK